MRARLVLPIMSLPAIAACGDGIGRPIVERDSEKSTGGTAAGTPGGGTSAGGGAGSGARGDPSGSGGSESFGGRGWIEDWGSGGRGPASGGFTGTGVPPGDYCARAAEWPEQSAIGEEWVLELLNSTREFGGISCSSDSPPLVAPRLAMKPELHCAARLHALDMAERDFMGHVNLDGVGPEDRMRRAGHTAFRIAGESIAQGRMPPEAFEALFAAGGSECENLVDPRFDSIGIGNFEEFWVLDFTGP